MNKHIIISIFLITALLAVLPMSVSADVYVSPGDDIQAAVNNAAANGGTVYFSQGTYYVNLVINAPAMSFALRGAGAGVTILDGDENGSVIYVEDTGDCVVTIEGFTIMNGTGSYSDYYDSPHCGGGIYVEYANIVVADCTFEDNYVEYSGGGIHTFECYAVTVTGSTFKDNYAGDWGGGIDNNYSLLTMSDCAFLNNYADYVDEGGYGGGLDVYYSEATVTDCTFEDNYAYYDGGGISNYNSNTTVTNCSFSENTSDRYGGGMYNYYATAEVVGCTFEDNYASDWAGGMENEYSDVTVACSRFVNNSSEYAGGMENYYSDVTVTNSVFTGNEATYGGALYNDYMYSDNYLTYTNCTFTGNEATYGGAMFIDDDYYPENITVTNCILWGDSNEIVCMSECDGTDVIQYSIITSNDPVVTYSDVQGGYPGEGNIDANPFFVLAPSDVSLGQESPCIDAGKDASDTAYGEVVDDIVGVSRPQIDGYDMGAYEFVSSSWATVSIQPLARTQLQSVLSLWEDLLDRLPEEPTGEMIALIAQAQEHMANATQLTNPIYASGQLSKALAAMQQLATLLA